MRTAAINTALEKHLSRERLEKYLARTGGDLDKALALYERNTRLSEAFYTPLQCLEVCFRNRLSLELKTTYGDDWFRPGKVPFERDAVDEIVAVVEDLKVRGKAVTTGAVVAELRFGFWVAMLGPRYDAGLWRKALFRAFLKDGRTPKRGAVHGRLNAVRRFRNRIAHHEPILFRDLPATHNEIIEATQWMCPETAAWAAHHSRFPAVFAAA